MAATVGAHGNGAPNMELMTSKPQRTAIIRRWVTLMPLALSMPMDVYGLSDQFAHQPSFQPFMKILHSTIFCIALSAVAAPSRSAALEAHDRDSALVVAATEKFHAALAASDSAAVKLLLANDVVVLESGELEGRADYLAHHMGADMEFARTVQSERKVVSVTVNGNSAWLVAKSTTAGNFRGRAINSQGVELMVLTRTNAGWKIRAIHWSSARRQP